jgi:hypothetical protein
LGKDVRARFVDKARIHEYVPWQPTPTVAQETGQKSGVLQDTGSQDVRPQSSPVDPYEEAKSDPVVQDLVRRGGQVTDVELEE